MCSLHGKPLKSPCVLCVAVAYCCGAVALRVTAALLGRFLPRLGPLVHYERPFFLSLHFILRVFASIRASEAGPVDVLAIRYDQLNELLGQSDVTREALHQSADRHEAENIKVRGVVS